jgi:ABC-type protease/lipase transport system fused ATPase/permease subunit
MASERSQFEGRGSPAARFGWLELTLSVAAASLYFQLFPAAWDSLMLALDFRLWSRPVWFSVNLAAVLALVLARGLPDWKSARAARRASAAKTKKQPDLADKERNARKAAAKELRRLKTKGVRYD